MFTDIIKQYNWNETTESIYAKTLSDAERALNKVNPTLEDFKALVSPAAKPLLEAMAAKSRAITQQRFGKTIGFYLPIYLSNECSNHCIYCGFNHNNPFKRVTLSDQQIMEEIQILKNRGFDTVLLLTGEAPRIAGVDYISHAVEMCKKHFSTVNLEVFPMSVEGYKQVKEAGVHGVYIYQETYNESRYKYYHPKGMKSNYEWRLETPDRLGLAGMHTIGLGALIGLEEWRTEMYFMAMHLKYLRKTYWKSKYAVAFPRMRPAEGGYKPNFLMDDHDFAQTIWAFRLFDHDVEMSMTTREPSHMRDHFVSLGITSMSAGSQTEPGGYAHPKKEVEQFHINDDRTKDEMEKMVREQGYEVVYKDWDQILN